MLFLINTMQSSTVAVLNAKHDVPLRRQVFKDSREPRHSVPDAMRKYDRDHFRGFLAAFLSYLSDGSFYFNIQSYTLELSEWPYGEDILAELHESFNRVLTVLRPLVVPTRCVVIGRCRIVYGDSIACSPLHLRHDTPYLEPPTPRGLKTVIEVGRAKEEHQQHRYQHGQVVIVVSDFLENTKEES